MFPAVSIRNIATDHVVIIYHAPPASNYLLTRVVPVPGVVSRARGRIVGWTQPRG